MKIQDVVDGSKTAFEYAQGHWFWVGPLVGIAVGFIIGKI